MDRRKNDVLVKFGGENEVEVVLNCEFDRFIESFGKEC